MKAFIADSKSAAALAVIRSLGRQGIEVTGASDNNNDFPLFSKYCKKKIILNSNLDDLEIRIEELLEIVKSNQFDVFIPVMREDLLLSLSKRKSEFERYTRLALSSFEQLNTLNDKSTVSTLLSKLGIPCPFSLFIDSEQIPDSIPKNITYPILIKPFRGEGSKGIKIIPDSKALFSCMQDIEEGDNSFLLQEFIYGKKYSAVFLINNNSEVKRFFVHRAIREFPVTGGPACYMESVKYEPIFEYGLKLLNEIHFTGIAEVEFIVDEKDEKPKIIDVNPRFYGSLQCAVSSGSDLPLAVFNLAMNGDIEKDLSYKAGVTCRHLLFEDTKHMISVLRGAKSPKYTIGKLKTLINYLNFFRDNSFFVLSFSDWLPSLKKIRQHL